MPFWTMFGVGVLGLGALILAVDLWLSRRQRKLLARGGPDDPGREISHDQSYYEAVRRAQTKEARRDWGQPGPGGGPPRMR